jgi:hypothetical protein
MKRISKGNETLVIGTAQEKELQEPLSFESHENAVQCLRSYLTDPYNTAILRKILYEGSLNCTVCSLSDLEVVSQVAQMVVRGQVVVAREKQLVVAGGSKGAKETELAERKKWDKEAYVAGFLAENAVTAAKIADDKIDKAVKDSGAEFEKKGVVKGKWQGKAVLGALNVEKWNPVEINGRRVYQRNDLFDPHAVDANGMTNVERMKKGRPPIGHDGESVNLHHMIQKEPGTLAEVGGRFHSVNKKNLHGLVESKRSFRYSKDGKTTDAEKAFKRYSYQYWQDRAIGFK